MVLVVVALIVVGPKELPKILRKLGQWSGKIRRFALDMRVQSGIDEALRTEGLSDDINEIRKLARGELDHVVAATRTATNVEAPPVAATSSPAPSVTPQYWSAPDDPNAVMIDREREYPVAGADSYGALPDTAIVYAEGLPASKLADDPLYTRGEVAA
jgi:sec-independent protein translocase protein TatB